MSHIAALAAGRDGDVDDEDEDGDDDVDDDVATRESEGQSGPQTIVVLLSDGR